MMYGHNPQSLVSYASADLIIDNLPSFDATALPPPLLIPPTYEFDSMGAVALPKLEVSYSCSSGCSSYESPCSLTSYSVPSPILMQRSISSLSLQKNNGVNGFCQHVSSTSLGDFVDPETSHVRRVFSTGDLQRINMGQHCHRSESPLSNENHSIIESMSKACRYNPEEKKERIERYRSKRNQRNFNKKIKYVCRKTLADSRLRIRGRFARNDEIGNSSQIQRSQMRGEEDYEDDDNWIHFLDSFMGNLIP